MRAQRHYPIVFTGTGKPYPAAVLGLRVDQNLFIGPDGRWVEGIYVPAYVRRYPFVFIEAPEDKLILAIDELSLLSANAHGLQALVDTAAVRAKGLEESDPDRAGRLDAAVARGLLAVGRPAEANGAAALSLKLSSGESKAAAAWRVFPTLYDGLVQTKGDSEGAALVAAFGEKFGVPPVDDPQVDPATQVRLMKVAERTGKLDEANRRYRAAVANVFGLDRHPRSLPALRHALTELNTSDDEFEARVRADPAFARRSYAEVYRGMYDDLLVQSRSIFVSDARDRMLFSSKVDRNLNALGILQATAPELRAEIAERSFRLAQLRSYGRLTLATVAAGLQSSTADANTRFHLERFFTLTTETSVWLRGLSNRLRVPLEAPLPDGQRLWESVGTLDVFHHEMTGGLPRSIEFVKRNAPQVGALITPHPSSPSEIQQELGEGEALIATIVTASNLYVWAIGRKEVVFARISTTRKQVFDLVRRLRKSLAPADESGRPQVRPFDAAAAWELYRLMLEPVVLALAGVSHLYWYGHEALGTIPPQVLLTGKPAQERMSDAADLSAAPFLTERYAVTVLPDLSAFGRRGRAPAASSDTRSFIGIGAPGGSAPGATMGARDRDFLAGLPQLPDADSELRRIATVVGGDRSTLWVGADADETRLNGDALRDYSLISFATHGLSPGDLENLLEPALLLSLPARPRGRFDGLLTASEIARLPMRADLVILSACNTAASDGRPRGEALTGLGQAFLTAGARALMVSHWPVRSGAAAALSVGIVEGVRGGSPVSASLQGAIAKLRAERSNSDLGAHPSYWGPFVIVGG